MPRYRCAVPTQAVTTTDWLANFLIKQPLDEAAYYLSCIYAVLCDQDERRDLAMYFTPPTLARHILESVAKETTSFNKLRFMDPACGGAAFLLPVVITLRDLLKSSGTRPRDIVLAINKQIIGVEKNGVLAELSRQFIRIALAEELAKCDLEIGSIIQIGDALRLFVQNKLPRVNVLLCNPPYRKIRATELAWHRARFGTVIAGQPNLYTMFMRSALDIVIPGGLIALLTPTSYFSGPTYEKIRGLYSKRTSILRIDLVHERDNLFLGVEHDVAALLARPRLTRPTRQVPEIFGWREAKGWESLGSILLSGDARPWLLPRDSSTSEALIRARTSTWSLANYGYQARVGVYVWNRDERRPRKARPTGRDRKNAVPVIWATQIGQDGSFRFISKSAKEKRARYILLRANDRRGVVDSDCVVLQRTSSRGQSRRLVAAALPKGFAKQYGGFVGENHVIILEPTDEKPLVPRIALARLLNSAFMRDLYSTTTGTTAVTVSGLNVLPLPDPRSVARLVKKCGMEQAIRGAFGLKSEYQRMLNADAKIAAT